MNLNNRDVFPSCAKSFYHLANTGYSVRRDLFSLPILFMTDFTSSFNIVTFSCQFFHLSQQSHPVLHIFHSRVNSLSIVCWISQHLPTDSKTWERCHCRGLFWLYYSPLPRVQRKVKKPIKTWLANQHTSKHPVTENSTYRMKNRTLFPAFFHQTQSLPVIIEDHVLPSTLHSPDCC